MYINSRITKCYIVGAPREYKNITCIKERNFEMIIEKIVKTIIITSAHIYLALNLLLHCFDGQPTSKLVSKCGSNGKPNNLGGLISRI